MIKINNINSFNGAFLSLISKVCDNACITVDNEKLYSITNSSDNTIVIFSIYKQPNNIDSVLKLNIPDINRLIRIFSCIREPNINLEVDSNCIKYKSPDIRFKYHLLEDGIISVPAVSLDKIRQLDFKYSFNIQKNDILSLIKGSSFVVDIDKLYFYAKDDCVFAELTDKETSNTDSYTQKVSDKLEGTGEFEPVAISFEIIRIISGLRFDNIKVKINTDVNVLLFEVDVDETKHSFICTTYIR